MMICRLAASNLFSDPMTMIIMMVFVLCIAALGIAG